MNFMSRTERYVYLKTGVDPRHYEAVLAKFDGNQHRALQHLRIRFAALVAGIAGDAVPGGKPVTGEEWGRWIDTEVKRIP